MAYVNSFQYVTRVSSYFRIKCAEKTIDTIVASQGDVVEQWVNEILSAHACDEKVVVGLDIKQRRISTDNSATMQLCIDTKCLIIQFCYIGEIPQSFKSFLMNPKFTFVGVDGDMSKLVSEHGLSFAKSVDFRVATINKWPIRFKEHDLKYLAKELAGCDVNIPDQASLNGWGSSVLNEDHLYCACVVAYASYRIGKAIFP